MNLPRPALALTALGILPFLFGTFLSLSGGGFLHFGTGTQILLSYGQIILSFMGGCLWGFGAKSDPEVPKWYVLSVLPALWAFLVVGQNLWLLAFGFALLLGLDFIFHRSKLAPVWWMRLRIPVSVVVILCLITGAMA